MPSNDDGDLRALWRDQPTEALRVTPEQLRARAAQFESQALRRYRRDQIAFGVLVLAFGGGVFFMDGGLLRLGCAMLAAWALYGMYGLRRFGAPLSGAPDAQACAVHHRRQLERQRDIVLSWPLGIGLAAPGFVLYCLGFPLGPKHLPWPPAIALLGLGAFAYLATVIYGKILAGLWQQEIDDLKRAAASER